MIIQNWGLSLPLLSRLFLVFIPGKSETAETQHPLDMESMMSYLPDKVTYGEKCDGNVVTVVVLYCRLDRSFLS